MTTIPTHPSNKNTIEQAKLNGWVEAGTGPRNTLRFRHPGSGKTVDLQPPGYHDGNSNRVFQALYSECGGRNDFWAKEPLATINEIVPPQPMEPRPTGAASQYRGAQQQILKFLMAQGSSALSVNEVAKALNIPASTASNSLAELFKKGEAERPVRGTYRIAKRYQPNVRVHHDLEKGTTLTVEQMNASVPLSDYVALQASIDEPVGSQEDAVPQPDPAPLSAPPQVNGGVDEETVYALLDLLLPGGFKAKDLPAINEWVAASNRLVQQVKA